MDLPDSQSTPTTQESNSPKHSKSAGWAVGAGLVVICVAVSTLNWTARTWYFWLYGNDYVRTEFTVTDFNRNSGDSGAFADGIVAETGEELRLERVPSELYVFDSPSDPVGMLTTRDEAIGKRIPIWFARHGKDPFFGQMRVQFVSEFNTLPGGQSVLIYTAVNVVMFVGGVWLVASGARRRKGSGTV